MGRTVIVVAGGDPVDPAVRAALPDEAPVVAADSGIDRAAAIGLSVDIAVGDFDSVTPEGLAAAVEGGTVTQHHPRDKDQIDLELALDAAVDLGAARIIVVGGHGGRVDLFWANGLVLASPRYAGIIVEALVGPARVHVVRGGEQGVTLRGQPGELVTLLPVHGPARRVRTEGLRFPLDDEDLPSGTSRGVSNELLATTAEVSLDEGTLLAVLPGAIG